MTEDPVGDRFQRETRYVRGRLPGGGLDFSRRPEPFKQYPDAPRTPLAAPKTGEPPLSALLLRRRSIRRFSSRPLAFSQLSTLLWAAAGIREIASGHAFRTAPSAGALYPIETYIAVKNVEGLEAGLYHYFAPAHCVERLEAGDFSRAVAAAALDQRMCLSAACTFLFSAVFFRSKWKYRQRAYRYIYIDAGHMAQNLALAAVSLDLGTCAIGAIYDDEADALLDLDPESESVIYMTAAGHPAGSALDGEP
ncbi:MAG: SagB/ThcOx family dehydrogenase [Thermodesulfobacteriota bacterium]